MNRPANEVVRLDDLACLPLVYQEALQQVAPVLCSTVRTKDAVTDRAVRKLAESLEAWIRTQRVRTFHVTRERHPGFYRTHGLRALDIDEHTRTTLQWVLPQLAPALRDRCEQRVREWIRGPNAKTCPGRVHFVMCASQLGDYRAYDLQQYYGGEVFYRAFMAVDGDDEEMLAALASLGNPVVVESELPAGELHSKQSLASDLLAHVAHAHHPHFPLDCTESWIMRPVQAEEIVAVHDYVASRGLPGPSV